jgi:D-alanyl-lipoteichoic acid acyltransferase DltB (MBOAT superfamily)
MLFNSPVFIIFFIVVYSADRLLGRDYHKQNVMLLAASYLFYGWWDWRFLLLIVLSTTLDFCTSLILERGGLTLRQRFEATAAVLAAALSFLVIDWRAVSCQPIPFRVAIDWDNLWNHSPVIWWSIVALVSAVAAAHLLHAPLTRLPVRTRRRLALGLSIAVNLGILGFFKYFNFFAESFSAVWQTLFGSAPSSVTLEIILPVGISFYTFQSMSYTIDVYRGDLKASLRWHEYAVFVSFFPQLVAGPIERASHLLPQFQRPRVLPDASQWRSALWLIAWGLYKKVVVADNMAIIVHNAFGPFDGSLGWNAAAIPADGLRLLIGVYAFAFQIYGDFSGYTDIARGTAKLLGFDIMLNFNLPYFACSPSDFWRRWHISLSTWLRDYLYISLGGNRGTTSGTYRNLLLTMLLGGLWHGASWTFVLWGAYHGLLLIAFRLFDLKPESPEKPIWVRFSSMLAMFHLTCLGWLLFRAQNLETVRVFVTAIGASPFGSPETWEAMQQLCYFSFFLLGFQLLQFFGKTLDPMPRLHWFVRATVWTFILMSILRLMPKTAQEFIYFAF